MYFQEHAHGLKERKIVTKQCDSMNLKRIFFLGEENVTVQDQVKEGEGSTVVFTT